MPVLPALHGLTERLRDRICSAPSDVLREVETYLADPVSRTDRVRLLGLGLACCRNLSDFRRGNALVRQAGAVTRTVRHPMARAEWALQLASFRGATGDRPGALQAISEGLEVVEAERARSPGTSKAARQRRDWFEVWALALRVVRGEIFYLLSGPDRARELRDTFADVLGILQDTPSSNLTGRGWTGHNRRRLHIGAVVLLGYLVMETGHVAALREVLVLLRQAEEVLIYRLKRNGDDGHRLKIRMCRALILARLGSTRPAEGIMLDVLERFTRQGQVTAAAHALEGLCWILERAGQTGRVAFMRQKWGG